MRIVDLDKEAWEKVIENDKENDIKKPLELGWYYSHAMRNDLKHVAFMLSRYKFVSKLLMYKNDIRLLELGCQEGLGALMFSQELKLKQYTGIDLDTQSIQWNKKNLSQELEFIEGNFFDEKILESGREYDAVVSIDVIEHIQPQMERKYCEVITKNLSKEGVAIIGTPSIKMEPYASEGSKIGHINLYDQNRFYEMLSQYFHNVFIFNMNDEIVHTGFNPMACYMFALCCNKKSF